MSARLQPLEGIALTPAPLPLGEGINSKSPDESGNYIRKEEGPTLTTRCGDFATVRLRYGPYKWKNNYEIATALMRLAMTNDGVGYGGLIRFNLPSQ